MRLDVANAFRDDAVRPSLDREAALANAPQHDGECYLGAGRVRRRIARSCDDATRPPRELVRQLADGANHFGRAYQVSILDRIERHDGRVKAFLRVDPAAALAQAEEIDRRRKAGKPLGPLAGLPVAVKDVLCIARRADDVRLADVGSFSPALRRYGRGQTEGGRRRAHRADEHGRVRHGRVERKLGLLPDAQSLGPLADSRRQQRRLGGGRGRQNGPAGRRHRHRRLDPLSRRTVRHLRTEADLRPREPLRAGRLRQQSRPDRPDGPNGRRLCPVAGSAGRPRPERFHLGRSARAAIQRNGTPPAGRIAAGTGPRAFRRRARRRGRSGGARGGAGLSIARGDA